MRVLVSGFEPFGGESVNPSQRVVEAVRDEVAAAVVLPVVFSRAWRELAGALEATDPEVVLALGQAAGVTAVSVEQVAVNLDDPESPDEAGVQPEGETIVRDAPLAYLSGLPVRDLVNALRAQGLPARRSRSAGGHLCNHVFYRLCHVAATERPGLRAGFVHLPYLPEQTLARPAPSMPLAAQVRAVRTILAVLEQSR